MALIFNNPYTSLIGGANHLPVRSQRFRDLTLTRRRRKGFLSTRLFRFTALGQLLVAQPHVDGTFRDIDLDDIPVSHQSDSATDGYSRANTEAFRLLKKEREYSIRALNIWIVLGCIAGMVVILFFKGSLAPMLKFAMITAFLTTPVFAWLNLMLARGAQHKISRPLMLFSWLGLLYLVGFAVLFLLQLAGLLS